MKNENIQLIATVKPDDASDKNINWTSSNAEVATVSTATSKSGTAITVRGIAKGTATITATAVDGSGKTASCTVIVKELPKEPSISVTSGMEGNNGWYRSDVTVTITPNAANVGFVDKITYTLIGAQTQNETEGTTVNITAEGITTITAWVYDTEGQKSNPKTFEVKKDSIAPELNGLTDLSIPRCDSKTITYGISTSDETSGVAGIICSPAGLVTGTNEYTYTVTDNAGNLTTGKRKITYQACFVAGTKVSTPDGLINIEDLKIGNKVYTYNEGNKEIEEKEILNTFVNDANELLTIKFENGEEIKNTDSHPYYVVGKSWTLAKDLRVGDEILTQNQTTCKITKIEVNNVEITKVYNIEIKDNHNYFVGEENILVHNKTCTSGGAL